MPHTEIILAKSQIHNKIQNHGRYKYSLKKYINTNPIKKNQRYLKKKSIYYSLHNLKSFPEAHSNKHFTLPLKFDHWLWICMKLKWENPCWSHTCIANVKFCPHFYHCCWEKENKWLILDPKAKGHNLNHVPTA